MSVVGSISIKDNATAALKRIRGEQAAFRSDVVKTRGELKATWDKTYTAKIDTASSVQKTAGLLGKVKQLGKEIAAPVIRVKDEASAKITKIKSAARAVGNQALSPVIRVRDEASARITRIAGSLKAVGNKIRSPVIRVRDEASARINKVVNSLKSAGKKIVSPVIRVKDMASRVLGPISSKIKSVGGLAAKPVVALKDRATAGLSTIRDMLGTLSRGVIVGVGLAGAGLAAVAGGALGSGADLEQNIGGIETLFKDSASVVKANADKAFRTAGLSANAYMETVTGFSASLLQSLGGDTAKAADMADMALIDMADNANKMGTSMESIQNAYSGFAKQNYTMLDNLKLGYGGTKEEMQRLLGDAQKISGVKYDIGSLADVYNAIHVIQGSLDITGTTAKEASETFSGSFASMKSAVSNLLGSLAVGGDVKTSMEQVVDTAATFLLDNALPMIGNVAAALPGAIRTGIKKAAPKIKKAAPAIIKSLKEGLTAAFPSLAPIIGKEIDTAAAAFPAFVSGAKQVVSAVSSIAGGFAPMLPQLTAFGSSMASTIQTVASACIPVLASIISTVQSTLPAVLPAIGSAVSTVGNIIAQAAPVIAGLVSGIGTAVSTLAPVFSTIFSGIGEKVGRVVSFLSERMGFIQEVISAAAPAIGTVLTTAWSVISPVLDLAISVFELIFSVVQRVFPGIQRILEGVWSVVGPIVQGIGSAIGKVADWISSTGAKISGSTGGGSTGSVGKNAQGDNNWKGGLTWVGEKGAELVDLPKGSRILPHKESVSFASAVPNRSGTVKGTVTNVVQNLVSGGGEKSPETLYGILDLLNEVLEILKSRQGGRKDQSPENPGKQTGGSGQVIIRKLADQIIVRNEEDIDDVADKVAKKVLEVVLNMG